MEESNYIYYDKGTYNPHYEDCYFCRKEWTEGDRGVGFHEHYICNECNERIQARYKTEEPK